MALVNSTTGNGNIALAFVAGQSVTTANNVICIGAPGADVDNSCFVGNVYASVQPIVGTDPDSVTIPGRGKFRHAGINTTSSRWTKPAKRLTHSSQLVFAITRSMMPRCYCLWLIAEDVAKVYPDLVDAIPRVPLESVCYDQINAMLVANEFSQRALHSAGTENDRR